jgi:hypothetical protein
MRLFHRSILLLCLLLAGSSLLVDRRAINRRPDLLDLFPGVVRAEGGCGVWLDDVPEGGRVTWSGGCRDFAEGVGRLEVFDRNGLMVESYYGNMTGGQKYGRGREMKNRDRYVGEFVSGLRSGYGDQIVGGVHYRGEFRAGERWGRGAMTWLSRDIYVGEWKHGLPDGYGEVIAGTERIAGQWRAGCLLDSRRLVAVATPFDACRGRVAARTPVEEDLVDSDPFGWLPEGGCRRDGGSLFLLCKSLFQREG